MSNTYGEWYKHPFPLSATHLLQVEGERGAEMPSYSADPCCTAGFPSSHLGAHKDYFSQDRRVREADTGSGKKQESALPAWTGLALYKHHRGLAITTKGRSSSVGKALHAAQRCQQGRAAQSLGRAGPGVHLVLPHAAEVSAGCCWHAAGTQGGRCSCLARQSHTTFKLRTDVRKEIVVSCCSGSKSPL